MAGRGRRELRDLADAVRLRPLEQVAPFLGYVRDPTNRSRRRRGEQPVNPIGGHAIIRGLVFDDAWRAQRECKAGDPVSQVVAHDVSIDLMTVCIESIDWRNTEKIVSLSWTSNLVRVNNSRAIALS